MSRLLSAAALALAALLLLVASPQGRTPATAAVSVPAPWPNLGSNAQHTGYRADPKLGTQNAASLGVNWMTRLYFADIGSPIVAYNAPLKAETIYAGDENGDVFAVNEATGAVLWSVNLGIGNALRATPLYVKTDNSLWVDTVYDQRMHKLDARTGQQLCSFKTNYNVLSSPIYVELPDGTRAIYFGVQDGAKNGPEIALDERNCALLFAFSNYRHQPAGSWASAAFGLTKSGEPAIVFGTADIDSTVYAVDAKTGKRLWYYNVYNPPNQKGPYEIGSAPTVTAPGVNGFADGAAYVSTKYGYVYAFDLTTGAALWQYDEFGGQNVTRDDIAGMAIDGSTLVGGFLGGVYAVNAVTGTQLWQVPTVAEPESTPNIIGSSGQEIVTFADLSGKFYALALSNGQQLYSYQTGGYVTASPAETNGHLILVSTDGFLYDFAPGGGNVAPPASSITAPSNGSTIANPNGNLTVQGAATDANAVTAVEIGVQSGGRSGPWWNAAASKWQSGPVSNPATLQAPNQPSTSWSFSFPVAAAGGPFAVFASAVNAAHQADRTGALSNFIVQPSASAPNIAVSPAYVPPAGTTTVSGNGFGASETVTFTLYGTTVGSAMTSSAGVIPPTPLSLPAKSTLGPTTLVATGATSHDVAVAPFTVGNSWTQTGGNAQHTSFESNDPLLAQVLHVGPGIFISPAYYYNATSPSSSSAVVVNGTAYFGNDTGLMSAVTSTTGAPAWTYQINSSAAIQTTPAVDAGTVYFGASDGNAYALSAATGALLYTIPIGGNVSSPAIGNGYVAFTSDNGSLTIVSEASGNVVTSLNLGVAIHSSPLVDTAAGTVVVGDDSGAVSAFALPAGNLLWKAQTNGPVYAPAAVANGVLYVGSTDGSLYALSDATGAVAWTYATGAPIRTCALLNFLSSGTSVAVGNDAGNVYALTGAGALKWQHQLSAAVAGIGAAANTMMVDTADGLVWALRPAEAGEVLMNYATGSPLATVPAVNNGAVYVASRAGGMYVFTPYGYLPFSKNGHAKFRKTAPRRGASGSREYAIHFDWPRNVRSADAKLRSHGGPVQPASRTYAIFWIPPGSDVSPRYVPGIERFLSSAGGSAWYATAAGFTGSNGTTRDASLFGGAALDRTAYPRTFDDAAVRRLIERAIARNAWRPGIDAQFLVFTARGAVASAAKGSCSYHSAFNVSHRPAVPAVYAVVPDLGRVRGCGTAVHVPATGDAELDAALSNVAHEAVEMATDPLLDGWYDAAGREAGDVMRP